MRLLEKKYLIPMRPFLLRYFPVFIGVIFSGIFGGTAAVVLMENYYFPSLSNAAGENASVVLALFITLCNVMIGYGRPNWVWGMRGLFLACLLIAVPGLYFSPHPFIYVECFFWPLLGLLLLHSKRYREFLVETVELRHLRAKVVAAVKRRRKHERAIIRIKKPR